MNGHQALRARLWLFRASDSDLYFELDTRGHSCVRPTPERDPWGRADDSSDGSSDRCTELKIKDPGKGEACVRERLIRSPRAVPRIFTTLAFADTVDSLKHAV